MKKKTLLLVLAMVAAVSLSACGDKEEAEEISLDDLYELDKDVLIDDKFSVNEYVDGFKDIKGYAFQYELPGNWGRNLKQLFKEAMYNEYGKDAQLK